MADYGAFVEINQGVEGLIHVSEMSWTQHLRSAQDFLKVGDEIEAVVLTLDREERKMSLGMKQLKPDPWEDIETKYPVGSTHKAIVRNFTNFGIFVEIEEGVEGLVHISDLSWTKKIKHPSEITELGATIEIQVLEVDKENRRLSLGHKQLEENPWEVFETVFTVGSVHEGTVVELLDKGAVISLPYGVEAFATSKFLVKEDGSQAQLEEKLDFQIVEFNKDSKRILVSHSRTYEDDQAEGQKSKDSKPSSRRAPRKKEDTPVAAPSAPAEKSTLGDIEELAALKEKLDSKKISEAKAALDKREAKKEAEQEEAPVVEEATTEKIVEETKDAEDAKKVTAAAEKEVDNSEETKEEESEEDKKSEE
jgi:small subunit ribosomal protein S1